jgi:hypothetical protein
VTDGEQSEGKARGSVSFQALRAGELPDQPSAQCNPCRAVFGTRCPAPAAHVIHNILHRILPRPCYVPTLHAGSGLGILSRTSNHRNIALRTRLKPDLNTLSPPARHPTAQLPPPRSGLQAVESTIPSPQKVRETAWRGQQPELSPDHLIQISLLLPVRSLAARTDC